MGALLFFCLKDLCVINCMYKYGLTWFNYFLRKSFENVGVYKTFMDRLEGIKENITYTVFTNISVSLFEDHKLLFPLIVCFKMELEDGKIEKGLLKYFL